MIGSCWTKINGRWSSKWINFYKIESELNDSSADFCDRVFDCLDMIQAGRFQFEVDSGLAQKETGRYTVVMNLQNIGALFGDDLGQLIQSSRDVLDNDW